MTNTTTTASVIEMVIASGVNTAAAIEAFVTGLGRNVTVDMLNVALDELMVAHTSRQTKAVKINLFARALEMDIDDEDFVSEINAMREPQAEVVEVEGVIGNLSAAGETLVAETNQKEEVHTMNEQQQVNYRNQKAIDNSNLLAKAQFGVKTETRIAGLTAEVQSMIDNANGAMKEYFRSIGEFNVRVENIWFYVEKEDATREEIRERKYVRRSAGVNKNGQAWEQTIIGEVEVRIPKDYMQIKFFNRKMPNPNTGRMGMVQWLDFNGYDAEGNRVAYDADFTKQRNNSRMPAEGTGRLILPIKLGKDNKPRVNLPMDADKNGGQPWPVFKTADVRYINSKNATRKDESMYVADNNAWFNAQVSAYIQVFTGEFAQQDYRNIHGFNKLCTTCAHSVRLFQRDEVNGDLDTSKKSRSVLNPLSILELAQVGGNLPSVVCGLTQEFVDVEATLELNDAEQLEKTSYRDEDGRVRYVGHNQVLIKGEAINKFEFRANGTKLVAEDCGHYHGNTPKSEGKVAAERAAKREQGQSDYVSPFYKELPQVERQFIQTLVRVEGKTLWIPKFPGEVEKPLAVRVKSAGLNVVGAPRVFKFAEKGFIAPMVEFDTRHADVMSKINQIFFAAFNMWKLDEAQANAIFELADNKPEGMTDNENSRWDLAVYWLAQAIVRAQEREAARKFPAITPFFFTTKDVVFEVEQEDGTVMNQKINLVEIPVEEVMGETMEREDEIGYGLGYKDLMPTEFSRYLNEKSEELVYDVITNGTRYVLVGEDAKDVELAAGALQQLVQVELTSNYYIFADGSRRDASLVSNIKRDADPAMALKMLKACDEVKDYIAELLGL